MISCHILQRETALLTSCFPFGRGLSKIRCTVNPIALRKAKIVYNFGLSECNRVRGKKSTSIENEKMNESGRIAFPKSVLFS